MFWLSTAEARGERENADECWPWTIIAAAMMATLDRVQWATASPGLGWVGCGEIWCDGQRGLAPLEKARAERARVELDEVVWEYPPLEVGGECCRWWHWYAGRSWWRHALEGYGGRQL